MAETHPGRQRLERTLVEMSRGRRARRPRDREVVSSAGPAPGGMGQTTALELADLLARLDRIERKLSDLVRPFPASHETFGEWVRQGYWAHIRFEDFLRLKRAGML